jgi:F0F1-type ATP synthase assembly protein I
MKGSRKFAVIVLYIFAVTAIALAVVFKRYDSLMGVGAYAGGLATGVTAFMWGNRAEHAVKKPEGEK